MTPYVGGQRKRYGGTVIRGIDVVFCLSVAMEGWIALTMRRITVKQRLFWNLDNHQKSPNYGSG